MADKVFNDISDMGDVTRVNDEHPAAAAAVDHTCKSSEFIYGINFTHKALE